MMSPCSESFWLRGAVLDYIGRSNRRVTRDDVCKEFRKVDRSLVIGEIECLGANGKIRMLYDDMTCLLVLV